MTSHSSQEQLLRYLDGELSNSAMRKTAAHLQACWSCQVEFDRLKQHIALIVDAEAELFGPSLQSPPKPWTQIEPRLEKARERSKPFWRKLFTPPFGLSLAYGAPALALLIVGILVWAPVAPVSANEVLSKAIVADKRRQSITLHQIVRQRVRIRKTAAGAGERTTALQSWKSAKSAYWSSGADPVNAELLARYQANGLTSALPLSPEAVESWSRLAGSEPSASSEGQNVEVQLLANPAGQARGLKAVSFHVQTGNWHMDRMTLSFMDATFQISEEESSILGRHQVPNEVLAALEPKVDDSLLTSESATPASGAVAPSRTGESKPVNLDDLEMDVRSTLHGIGADLGEDIAILVRPPNQLVINAAGASSQRKEHLQTLLGNKPGVQLNFEEPVNYAVPRRAAAKSIVIPDAAQLRQNPDARLSQYFGSPMEQENYARSVLQTSSDILAHLYALRALAARWPPGNAGRLSAASKAKLAVMLKEHAGELRMGSATLKKELQLILKAEQANDQPAASSGVNWQQASVSGLDAASTVDRTLRALLTVSDAPLPLDQALPMLQQGSSNLERAVDELTKSLN